MAAGLGFKTFTTGEVLTAADVNGYLMQGVLVFASAAARNAAITSPQEGQFAFTKDTNGLWYYDGAAWVASGATGDIEGVTAGVGITGGGTSGTVTITNDMATTITAAGDIVVGTGSGTYDNLPIGTTAQVLTADTTVSPYKVKWATPASGGGMTLLSTTTLSGASTTISSISQSYQHLYVIVYGVTNATADGQTIIRANSEASIYYGTNIRNTTIGTTAGGGITFEQGSRTSVVNINAVTFWDYADTFSSERHLVSGIGYTPSNTNFQTWGGLATASTVSSLYFYNSGGNFSGGTVEIWGIK